MSLFDDIKSDVDLEKSGVWKTWTNGKVSIDLLLARNGGSNKAFKIASEKKTRTYRRAGLDLMQVDFDKQDDMTREVYADTIILGWRGEYIESKNLEFTRENVIALLKSVPSVMTFCVQEASTDANYTAAALEAEAGN